MNVEAVLERLRDAYEVPDMAGLAACLEMDETTFRVWVNRKSVPTRVLVKASTATGRSVSWLTEAVLTAEDSTAREPLPAFLARQGKQVNLNKEEQALLDNFRAASPEGRLAITATGAAMAQQKLNRKKSA